MLQAEMEVDEEEQGALMKDALRADSVAVLLGQALQAQDRALLERCSPPSHASSKRFADAGKGVLP